MRTTIFSRLAVAALFLAAGFCAQAATVSAVISADETSVGQPVGVQVRVDGTTNVAMPEGLGVPGLQSRLTGRSTQVSIINGRMTTSGIYTYTVVPEREGTFEIPPIEVNAEGRKIRTAPLKLTVTPGSPAARPVPQAPAAGGAPGSASASAGPPEGSDKLAWGELVVPRERIYAGEIVPVEVRYFFNGSVPFRLLRGEPVVSGEGFTFQKFAPPTQAEETINGVRYNTLTFRTAITAVKSGEMPLPKVALETVAQVPAQAPRGMDDIFSRFFGGQGPGFVDEREVRVETAARPIRVLALPAKGRPEGFSGAVGEFTVAATAAPAEAAAGDPVTLSVAVSGRGNFDAMGEPRLVNPEGWRVYPPTDRFEKTDDIGFTGTKTFEMPLVAQQARTETPMAEFSYFDPVKEKYVTVRTEPVPVRAAAPAASPAVAANAAPAATPTPTPAPEAGSRWLEAATPRSWEPLARRPVFWIANAAAALVLIGLLGAGWIRRMRQGPAAERAAWQRERDRAAGALASARLADAEFLDRALEALAAQARLTGAAGAVEYVRGLELGGREVGELRALLLRSDERKFSGGAGLPLEPAERQRWAQAVKEVCR